MKILAPFLAAICLLAQPACASTLRGLLGRWMGEQDKIVRGETHVGIAFYRFSIFQTTGLFEEVEVKSPTRAVVNGVGNMKTHYFPEESNYRLVSTRTENGRERPEADGHWHFAGGVLHSNLHAADRDGTKTLHLSPDGAHLEVTASYSDGTTVVAHLRRR